MRTESYVVRIYRRGGADRRAVVGIVEAVPTGWQKPFQSLQELAQILAAPGRARRRSSIGTDTDRRPHEDGKKP